jgi:zinc-ribbon domain
MFCPKCATQNLEGASYCRVCGANISLVPQALSGQLLQKEEDDDIRVGRHRRRRRGREPTIDHAVRHVFMGIAFAVVAIALSFSIGRGWWFWMLIPAFSMFGTGVAQYLRLRDQKMQALTTGGARQTFVQNPSRAAELPARNTGELVPPPPSVTEGTTRHLGAEAPTRHLDASTETPK